MPAVALGITILTALWWMFEAIPIPIASLVPIALLPLFGILNAKTAVAQSYGHPLFCFCWEAFFFRKEWSGAASIDAWQSGWCGYAVRGEETSPA
jgi:sodium-dependent dicarboxylate transporter 2/3/5